MKKKGRQNSEGRIEDRSAAGSAENPSVQGGKPDFDDHYLEIVVELGRPPTPAERRVVAEIATRRIRGDFMVACNKSGILCGLRTLDPDAFEGLIREAIIAAHPSLSEEQGCRQVFDELFTRIMAVKSYGIRNGMRMYVGYNSERKVRDRKHKKSARGAVFYAADHRFTDDVNTLPPEFFDRICCGDAETLLARIPSNCIDLVFTSPPYNFGLGYDTSPDGVDWERYYEKLFAVLDECIRVLKFGGRLIVNIQPLFSDYIPSHHLVSAHCMERKLIWRGEILWEKHNYNCKYTAWGSWKSPSSPYLKYTWEFLEIFSKGDLKKTGKKEDADITAGEFKEWVLARWSIAPERHMQEYGHPAMFPSELAMRVLKLFSFRGDIILDPFNGTGTTCLTAKKTGRHYLGIDISPAYCNTAEERLSKSGNDEG